MSMELIAVLPRGVVPSFVEWQKALHKLALPFLFDMPFSRAIAGGFCPMRAGKVVSGVEIIDATGSTPASCLLPRGPHRIIEFRWSGDMLECACALSAAAALIDVAGATVHNPADGMARLDLHRLLAMAAETTDMALRENGKALSVQKVVRAIAHMPEMDWRFVIDGRIVCRSIEGPYLRGLHVDRTPSPGVYRFRVLQTLWCFVEATVYLNSSIELKRWSCGGLKRIVGDLREEFAVDEAIRRCVMADPAEPFLSDPRYGRGPLGIERAIMSALDGDGPSALPLLKQVAERRPTMTDPSSERRWRIVREVISCIEDGGDVGTVLYPLAEQAKARISLKRVNIP